MKPENILIIAETDQLIGYARGLSGLSDNDGLTGIAETIRRKVDTIVKAAREEMLEEVRPEICYGFGIGTRKVLNEVINKLIEAENAN